MVLNGIECASHSAQVILIIIKLEENMQIDNATEYDVTEIQEKIANLKNKNPILESRVYPMDDQPTNAKIFEKLESIERKLSLIFGDNVLIDGKFQKTGVL